MDWMEIISAVLGLSCVILAGRNSKFNFWVGYVYNIFLFMLFWRQHLYAAMILQPIAFAINIFGHYRWTHPKEEERSVQDATALKVSSMNLRQWGMAAAVVLIGGAVWSIVLREETADPSPWLDSYILMFTFLAQYLSAQKKWECWWVWLLVNIANIVLYITAGLKFMPIVSGLYLVNGVLSLYNWHKLYQKEEKKP